MIITYIVDRYNSNKIWVIKKSSCGHYYYNQTVCGCMPHTKFQRTTKKFLEDMLGRELAI